MNNYQIIDKYFDDVEKERIFIVEAYDREHAQERYFCEILSDDQLTGTLYISRLD